MEYPEVTVVIPTLNRPVRVVKAIESLNNQTYKGKIKCVVVDSSQDSQTEEMIKNKKFSNSNLKVKYIKNNNSFRAIDNWIVGANEFSTEYGKFLCDDDWLDPTYFEKCMDIFDKNEVDCVISNICVVKADGSDIRDYYRIESGRVGKGKVIDSYLGIDDILPVTPTAGLMKSDVLLESFYESLYHIACTQKLFGFDFYMSYYPVFRGEGSFIINESLSFSFAGDDSITLNVKKGKIAYCYFFALLKLIESVNFKINKKQASMIRHKLSTFRIRSLFSREYRELNSMNSYRPRLSLIELVFSQIKKSYIKLYYSVRDRR